MVEIVDVNILECLKDSAYGIVSEVIDSCADGSAQGEEEWNLVDKEDIHCQIDLMV